MCIIKQVIIQTQCVTQNKLELLSWASFPFLPATLKAEKHFSFVFLIKKRGVRIFIAKGTMRLKRLFEFLGVDVCANCWKYISKNFEKIYLYSIYTLNSDTVVILVFCYSRFD